MLGAFAVGKTSLVSRYVHSIFSDKYLTTLGVKIDKKSVSLLRGEMELILWDIYGEDEFQKVRMSYLQGAAAYLLVADGTRRETLDVARSLQQAAEQEIGKVPFVLALNKVDLADRWQVDRAALEHAGRAGLESRADQREDGRGRRRGVLDPRAGDGRRDNGGRHGQRRASGGRLRARDRHFRADARRRLCLGGHAAGLDGGFQQESDLSVSGQLP